MASRQASPTVLLILLCIAVCLVNLAVLMLGPLLVALAHAFQTSVAIVGQLAAATAIAWGITAPLAGPVSDAYGRRRILLIGLMLMALGTLGCVLAWNYRALLTCRLLTGVGAATVTPNSIAALAEVFPPTGRGKAIGWLLSATGVSAAVGVPLVAFLLGAGGWRLPFAVMGTASLVIWILLWYWFPRSQQQLGQALAFFSHYREVGSHGMFWYVLAANACQQMGFFGMFGYLAAYLMQTYHLPTAATAIPLALAGTGAMVGSFLGGRVADHHCRVALFALSCWGSGLLAALVFTAQGSPWVTVALACGTAALARISSAVTPTLLLELAGNSRTTATGLFTMSNQLGVFGGAALGGLMLAWGGFPRVGLFCLGVSVIAAVVIRLKVRDSAAFLEQLALRKGATATE
jgi:DHA1 family chloramphenicol resistance protein-like MFS transporter